ncbi:uncharacterized protein LOC117150258 [Drosophila mauritiana]|uniref:Uncharacterized protein LOC117150258 n=1 Tax=Drosophila mauritiana TaxID=7226 RepID=A0A6P8KV05_DROMA|nr:uncharacterized protein LOC117150258 [Drosophila mauritiana]
MAFCGGFFFADFPRFLCPSEDLQISPLSSNCLTWLCVIGATNATPKNSIRDPYAYSTMAGPAPLWAVCPLFTELLTYHHAKAATTVNCDHKDLDRGCLGRLPRLATTATRCKTTKLSYCFLAKIDEPNHLGIPFYWVWLRTRTRTKLRTSYRISLGLSLHLIKEHLVHGGVYKICS